MKKQAPTTSQRAAAATPSIIGNDVEIEGSITTLSEIQLDGTIKGNLVCGALVMGEHGSVQGDIRAKSVTVRGQVDGDIRATTVHLEESAVINGDVYHESLTVEAGAKLNGRFCYENKPDQTGQALPLGAKTAAE